MSLTFTSKAMSFSNRSRVQKARVATRRKSIGALHAQPWKSETSRGPQERTIRISSHVSPKGEGYADLAIELDPTSHEGYYWKSANLGRGGEVRGILNSLFKAKPMRNLLRSALDQYPEHPGSYYVLGIIYERVPGRPISFGNDNYSVCLGRKAIDALNAEIEAGIRDFVRLEYYTELARHLWARGWRSSKRMSEQSPKLRRFEQEDDVFVRNTYYEGSLGIPDLSDREEALQIIQWVIDEFEAKPALTNSDRADLDEARTSLAEWTE